ncbi:MAG TPA: isochorismatase family protein, partial [Acidimicrobiales bacterium]|nr:isochorismatase family protein [Acidimicrobiales bacterium]
MNEDRLRDLVEPSTTAVLTMELQRAIVGPGALLPALVDEVERTGMLDVVRRVCGAARGAGGRVVHCTAVTRADGAGAARNSRLMVLADRARRERGAAATAIGSRGAELVDGLEDERDVVVPRLHGLTPFTSTSLDQILRNLGVRTVVATGVSVNVGVLAMTIEAVNAGYQVVVVRDGVVGVPAEYGQAVLDNTLSMVATIVTSDELLAAW